MEKKIGKSEYFFTGFLYELSQPYAFLRIFVCFVLYATEEIFHDHVNQ